MGLEHSNHGNHASGIFTLEEKIQVVEDGPEIRSKAHDFVGDLGEIVLAAVVHEPGLSKPLNVVQLESFQTVSARQEFSLQYVGVVFLTDGADVDVEGPVVFLENSNDFLLTFVSGDVEGVFGLFSRRGELFGKQFASRTCFGEGNHGEATRHTATHFVVELWYAEGTDRAEELLVFGIKCHFTSHHSSPQRRTTCPRSIRSVQYVSRLANTSGGVWSGTLRITESTSRWRKVLMKV